jgi:hypothetical protein
MVLVKCFLIAFAATITAILLLIALGGLWDAWMGGNEGHP